MDICIYVYTHIWLIMRNMGNQCIKIYNGLTLLGPHRDVGTGHQHCISHVLKSKQRGFSLAAAGVGIIRNAKRTPEVVTGIRCGKGTIVNVYYRIRLSIVGAAAK